MTIKTSLIRSLQVLLAGRAPALELGTETNLAQSAPSSASDGHEVITSARSPIYTWAGVQLGTATTVSYELWIFLLDADGAGTWFRVPHTERADVVASEIDRYPLSGAQRVMVRITATNGTVTPVYGPCGEE
jgi:hypothetical protein